MIEQSSTVIHCLLAEELPPAVVILTPMAPEFCRGRLPTEEWFDLRGSHPKGAALLSASLIVAEGHTL